MTHPAADTTAVTPHGPSFPCMLREFPVDSTKTTTSWVLETLEADCALVSPLIKAQAAQPGGSASAPLAGFSYWPRASGPDRCQSSCGAGQLTCFSPACTWWVRTQS